MSNLTTIIRDVVTDIKAGFQIDFLAGKSDELNLTDSAIEMLIFLQKPFNTNITMVGGGRKYEEQIVMIFGKIDKFQNDDDSRELRVTECIAIYEQFIQRLKLVDSLRVKTEAFTQLYDDNDINLTGIVANITIERQIIGVCLQ